jgi:uncharacterized protein YecT (DUF1311 family)
MTLPCVAGRFAIPLLALCAWWPTSAGAQNLDCVRPRGAAERTLCASPSLREALARLSSDHRTVRAATRGRLRSTLDAQQQAWASKREAACQDTTACAAWIGGRADVLAALAARVSDSNPVLTDLIAIALTGAWQAGSTADPGLPPTLPPAGRQMQFSPGQRCAPDCVQFGLEPALLGSDENLLKASGQPASTPMPTVFLNGRAAHALLVLGNGTVAAVFNTCNADLSLCRPALQVWSPIGPGAAVVRLEAAGGVPLSGR